MAAHALLSASGSHRWIACTPSARLEEQFPERESSVSASEGTFAHEFAEMSLKHFYNMITDKRFDDYLKSIQDNEFYSADLENYCEEYIDLIIEKFEKAKERDKDAQLILESRLDFSTWVPSGFGRGDAIIIADGVLEICDLKYGRNIPVHAESNPQLRLYALGAYTEFNFLYDLKEIAMTIVQPRNTDGGGTERLTVEKLLEWGETIKPIAKQAYEGKGELVAGSHCQFCAAAPRCRELANYNMSLAKHEFKNVDLLNDIELADVLDKVDSLVKWANKVKEYCLEEALDGRKFNGYKLVEGRSISRYSDEQEVEKVLHANGYTDKDIYKPKELLGSTAMKKVLTTKVFNELISPLMVKPAGKPTLVPVSDKRPEFNSAKDDFEVIE